MKRNTSFQAYKKHFEKKHGEEQQERRLRPRPNPFPILPEPSEEETFLPPLPSLKRSRELYFCNGERAFSDEESELEVIMKHQKRLLFSSPKPKIAENYLFRAHLESMAVDVGQQVQNLSDQINKKFICNNMKVTVEFDDEEEKIGFSYLFTKRKEDLSFGKIEEVIFFFF